MGKFLYTIVCIHYTSNGIFETDLYEELRSLRMDFSKNDSIYGYGGIISYHVYSGQAVEYVIKKVLRDIIIDDDTRQFYSYYPPHSLMYDCWYDLKDISRMNQGKINIRLAMTENEFKKVYGR